MTTTRTKIKDIADAELPRKTHPRLTTTGIDLIILKTIDDLVTEEVRKYNSKIKSINSDQKELNGLKEKNDEESEIKKNELTDSIKKKTEDNKKYQEEIESGNATRKIMESIKNTEVINPENAIRENLQLVGYNGKDVDKVTPHSAEIHIQKILKSKFLHNDIRNEYSKRNLNYFDSLKNNSGAVSPAIPRG